MIQAFATCRGAALLSPVTARKLAAVGASFMCQKLLRATLLIVVKQDTFSKLDVLERSNPLFLINATNLMGDYFAEAHLCNGNKVHILASLLLQYMRVLLGSDDIRAHRSLATQLMQNGREVLSVLAQELDELSISIRLYLRSPPPISTIWLLLSADICLNKLLSLPSCLQQFYAAHLELTTEETFSEVSYSSWKKSPEKADCLKQALSVSQDTSDIWTVKNYLKKTYDLNTWSQQLEENTERPPPVIERVAPTPAQPITVRVNNEIQKNRLLFFCISLFTRTANGGIPLLKTGRKRKVK